MTIFWSITSLLELFVSDASGTKRELVEECKVMASAYLRTVLNRKPIEQEPA